MTDKPKPDPTTPPKPDWLTAQAQAQRTAKTKPPTIAYKRRRLVQPPR